MSTGALIIARLSSSRLPEKNIMKIMGKPMIQLLIERVNRSKLIDKVVITTSSLPSDDPLEKLATQLGVGCYRGPLDNIMERICGAAKAFKCDTIVELLGDNPLIHSRLIDDTTQLFLTGQYDYCATLTKEYALSKELKNPFTLGVRVQVYTADAARQYLDYPEYIANDEKHPCSFIFENQDRFKVGFLQAEGKWAFMNRPDLNFAVNYQKNFDFVRSIFEREYAPDSDFGLDKVYRCLDKHPFLYQLLGVE